ncbi:MAG: pyridoxamine 5'-phosphate oxidase family protein [Pseudomonadota bacterium]
MAERFKTAQEIAHFVAEPRLAILMYSGKGPAPTGVPVWFDWDGQVVRMFAGRTSPKVRWLTENPEVSVLVTNRVGEPEAWVAFDGSVEVQDFAVDEWTTLIDRVAPRYWDLSEPAYAKEIAGWRAAPESFVSLVLVPDKIRSGG